MKEFIDDHGYGCGYVGIPIGHPWYGKHYSYINDYVCIHGGLTYSENHITDEYDDEYWWIGFDTCHCYDNLTNCSKEFCLQEIESLKLQFIKQYEYLKEQLSTSFISK